MGIFDLFRKNSDSIVSKNVSTDLEKKLREIAKNEIRISYDLPDSPVSPTGSKIGGKPALPEDFAWPEFEGAPLSFMAQINLREVAEYDVQGILPKTGVLSFFYDMVSMTWGFEPSDKGSARVYYFSEEEKLSPCELPNELDEDMIVPELSVSFENHISIPDLESYGDDSVDWDEYYECRSALGYEFDEMGEVTKLLGYPDVIQNPMEEECERVTRGYGCGSPEDYEKIPEDEKDEIKAAAKEWTLLFQMGTVSTDDAEIMFGDCGHIYFWIKKSDLENCKFDNAWLILQCG